MKQTLTLLILCLLAPALFGQLTSPFQKDIDFLYETLKKTPGYKDQIKGERQKEYRQLYEKLKSEPIGPTMLDTFSHLSRLLWPIKDMHLGFWQSPQKPMSFEQLKDVAFVSDYQNTAAFKEYPKVNIDLDSLERVLQLKPLDSIEGVYQAGSFGKVGIFRTSRPDSLIGVMLSANFGNSLPGHLFGIFIETTPGKFRIVYADLISKTFAYGRNVGFRNGTFTNLRQLRKQASNSHAELYSKELYLFKTLDPGWQYLYLGTFRSSTENLKIADSFNRRFTDSLIGPNLIVDLRENGGGGQRCSDQFFKSIRKYAQHGKVHVLINRYVASKAEQFTLALKKLKNVKIYGETTAGFIAYGREASIVPVLPSGKFKVYNTDMKDPSNYLQYEEVGIAPDISLDPGSDWIEQIQHIK